MKDRGRNPCYRDTDIYIYIYARSVQGKLQYYGQEILQDCTAKKDMLKIDIR